MNPYCHYTPPSDEQANYHRMINLLIKEGTTRLRVYLENHLPPGKNLEDTIQDKFRELCRLKDNKRITTPQWNVLFPRSGTVVLGDLDLSLCVLLIRNIAANRNRINWNREPRPNDMCIEHDILRLRFLRNSFFHGDKFEMREEKFTKEWQNLANILIRLGTSKDAITEHKTRDLDPDASERYCNILREQYLTDKEQMEQGFIHYSVVNIIITIMIGILLSAVIVWLVIRDSRLCREKIQLMQTKQDRFIQFLSRTSWNARSATGVGGVFKEGSQVPYIMIADTMMSGKSESTESCCQLVRQIQTIHMENKGKGDIAWNFLIGEDGVVYEGTGWNAIGSHHIDSWWNKHSYGIAIIGEFQKRAPEPDTMTTLTRLIDYGISKDRISADYHLIGQCQVQDIPTPGEKLYEEIQLLQHWESMEDTKHRFPNHQAKYCLKNKPEETTVPTTSQEKQQKGPTFFASIAGSLLISIVLTAVLVQRKTKTEMTPNIRLADTLDYSIEGTSKNITILPREGWGARLARIDRDKYSSPNYKIEYIIVCDTMSPGVHETFESCCEKAQEIQNLHMDYRGWADIGFNFLIGEDGMVYEGRGWNFAGSHSLGWNKVSYGIAIIGDFKDHPPRDTTISTLNNLIEYGVSQGRIRSDYILYGTRQVRPFNTPLPGDMLYQEINKMKQWQPR